MTLCPRCGQPMPDGRGAARLSAAELDALSAWWHTGTIRQAAVLLSRAERTVINQLYNARIRNGVKTTVALAQLHMGQLRTKGELLASHNRSARKVA